MRVPAKLESEIRFMFPGEASSAVSPQAWISVEELDQDRFHVSSDLNAAPAELSRVALPIWLAEEITQALIANQKEAIALHAAAVAWNGSAIVLPAASGAGKSSLAAWLADKGYVYLSDEIALLKGASEIVGLTRGVFVKSGAVEAIQSLPMCKRVPLVKFGEQLVFVPPSAANQERARPCRMLVFPQYRAGAPLKIEVLTPAEAGFRLVACNLNARNFADGGFAELTRLARLVPAIGVEYGDFAQLEDGFDALLRVTVEKRLDANELALFAGAFAKAPEEPAPAPAKKTYPIQPATPRRAAKPKLTIGMATYDDYDGVYFSLQALRLYHPEIQDATEFLLIDNHPDGACADPLKKLEGTTPHYRYVPNNARRGTAARDFIFEEAAGEFVLCMDSHVFVVPGALKRLLAYFEANLETPDLVQGPLLYDDLANISTHFAPQWRAGMYGTWDCDERGKDPEAPPFDIPMQGLGLFACRRSAWPGFNPKFRGFGGEEGYIHEKFRQRGGRTLCLPFLRWMHRFNRPFGVPYSNTWEDRIRNYMIGHTELGLGTQEMEAHFTTHLGAGPAERILTAVREELAIKPGN
ncbi:MAG: glycosyltransferase [Methyloceanibacter sp.]